MDNQTYNGENSDSGGQRKKVLLFLDTTGNSANCGENNSNSLSEEKTRNEDPNLDNTDESSPDQKIDENKNENNPPVGDSLNRSLNRFKQPNISR